MKLTGCSSVPDTTEMNQAPLALPWGNNTGTDRSSKFSSTIENSLPPPSIDPTGIAWFRGSIFSMGTDEVNESLGSVPGLTSDP